jgi:adenylate cyclase
LRERGGQVLKFIGDAMLAIFAVHDEKESTVCRRALDAAEEALARLGARNAERHAMGAPVVEVDIALHLGEVLYGNVGAEDRLDFTVIGPAVNEAARIEKLCDSLDRRILASERFARAADLCGGRLSPLGAHPLRGVEAPQVVYGIADDRSVVDAKRKATVNGPP